MKIKKINRKFSVGLNKNIKIKHIANIYTKSNDQITFLSNKYQEYDVTRKSWGYYATPSINKRLMHFNYKTGLIKNSNGMFYITVVDKKKLRLFKNYLIKENIKLISWLEENLNYDIKKIIYVK